MPSLDRSGVEGSFNLTDLPSGVDRQCVRDRDPAAVLIDDRGLGPRPTVLGGFFHFPESFLLSLGSHYLDIWSGYALVLRLI